MPNNIALTKKMLDYAERKKLEIPKVSTKTNVWGRGKRVLAWRVSSRLHKDNRAIPVSQWRTQELVRRFFPMTMREKIYEQAQKAVAERWSKSRIQGWYGMGDVAWCAETWSYIKAKAGSSTPKMAYVPYIIEKAAHGQDGLQLTSSPLPGDGVCYDWNYDRVSDHIETLLSKNGPMITTAAGNSGPPYVIKRYRTTSNVIAWIRVTR